MKTRITVLSIFLAFIIAGCSSGLEENATLTLFLDFDGNSNSYSASALKNWPPKDDEWNSLRYNIALISISGGRSEISLRPSGSDPSTFTGTAPVGTYTIVVEAYSDNEIYARGSTSTTIKLGRNNAPITMHRAGIYELDIEILPKEIEILQGGSYTFTAIPSYGLEYRDDFANSTNPYKWSVSGSKSTISGSGNSATLFVGLDETASTLTVTVECATNNSTKPGTAKVAVKDLINAQIPVIRFQPNDKDYILGEPATLSVVVNPLTDGGDLTYQWFSSTENKNSGGTAISGETEADYNPDTTTAGTYYYYVEVTNTSSNVNGNKTAMVTSRAAKVTVIVLVDAEKPVITSDPQAGTYSIGKPAILSVVVDPLTDGGALTYQWYKNTDNNYGGEKISGATGSNYIPPTDAIGTIYYYVVVTNTNNSINGKKTEETVSKTAKVTVNDLVNAEVPNITKQPIGATYVEGDIATPLAIEASVSDGGSLSYQWYSNTSPITTGGSSIGGATGASYKPSNNSAGTFYYYVIVTNTITNNGDGGQKTASTISDPATVTFKPKVDAMAPDITSQPQSRTFTIGVLATLTVTASSPDSGSLSYQWYSNTSPINTGGSLISGATDEDYNFSKSSAGTFYYYVIVTNTITDNGDGGKKTVSTPSNPVTVIFDNRVNALAPTITTQPQNATFTFGGASATLTVAASSPDGGDLSYQWYSNSIHSSTGGSVISGATGASYSPPTNKAGTFYYYVVVTNTISNNGDGGIKSDTITSTAVTVTSQYIVTFDGNEASGTAPTALPVNSGSSVTLPNQGTLSKTGYNFDVWNTLANGTGTNCSAGASYTPTGNITLYAKWTSKTVAITLDSNGGVNGSVTSISGKYDETVGSDLPSSSPKIPTRSGHIFMGWSTTGGTTNTENFYSTTKINEANGVVNAGSSPELTLYAVWNSAPIFTITFADIDQAPSIKGPTISRSGTGGNSTTATIIVSNPGEYTSFNWYIDGFDTTITTSSITLNTTNNTYNGVGLHYMILEVVKDGIPYNKTITFEVIN